MKKVLSLILCLVMLLSLLPVSAFAEEPAEPQNEQEEVLDGQEEATEPEQDAIVEEPEEHTHDYVAAVMAATCTEQGYTTYTCACGDNYVDDYTDALGHTPEAVAEVPATCAESGTTAGEKCAVCGEVLDGCGEIPALGHTAEDVAEIPAEVGKPGVTAGKVCAVCGEILEGCEEIPALEKSEAEDEEHLPVRVKFDCDPADTVIHVYASTQPENGEEPALLLDESGEPTEFAPEADGSFLLLPGVYLYDAEAEGRETVEKAVLEVEPLDESLTPLTVSVELEVSKPQFEVFSAIDINPMYKDVVDEDALTVPELTEEDLAAAFEAVNPLHEDGVFFSSQEKPNTSLGEAAAELREGFVNREETIEIYIKDASAPGWENLFHQILDEAFVHTGEPREGDYLYFSYGACPASGGVNTSTNVYYYMFTPSFYTTAAQEREMDNKVDSILASLSLDGKTEYQKCESIYDYLCDHVTYDYANLSNTSYKLKYTGYAALINNTAVCQGYSNAFYRMCLQAGIDARIVSSDEMCHAWNIAGIGRYYYELDATWDSSGNGFPRHYFFLKGSEYWLDNHTDNNGCSVLGDQFNNGTFAGYTLSSTNYTETAQTGIEISKEHFPDRVVRELVATYADTDGNGYLSDEEISAVTELDLEDRGITTLQGIEYFTELRHLDCAGNKLTELDVSQNTKLESLLVGYMHDGSDNGVTHSGDVHGNMLTSLDLSHNPALVYVICAENNLTNLNLSGCTNLKAIFCYNNKLTSLNVSGCTALEVLSCPGNRIRTLDFTKCSAVKEIICWDNNLTSLKLTGCRELTYLSCGGNNLKSLNVSGCPALEMLYTSYEIQQDDGSYATYGNNLVSLDLSHNPALKEVQCFDNQLTSLNVASCSALEGLYCSNNQINTLILSGCNALVELYCFENKLSSLDLSGLSKLQTLLSFSNSLKELNLSDCESLKTLSCYNNPELGKLSISSSPVLIDLVNTAEAETYSDAIVYTSEDATLVIDPATELLTAQKGLSIYALTNNQSILVKFEKVISGCENASNYVVTDSTGKVYPLSYAGDAQAETGEANTFKLNFPDPLLADTYTITTKNDSGTCEFEISLHLSTYRLVDSRNVIIQLNEPIIGCTTAENYVFHSLAGEEIRITSAVSAFQEIGGEAPNVFRLTTAKNLQPGTTYVVETRGMSWNGKPCQGTIGYFTMEDLPESKGLTIHALTNNQSILVRFDKALTGMDNRNNYVITNSAGQVMTLSYAGDAQGETGVANTVKLNFPDPLAADSYHIKTRNMGEVCECDFEISLNLTVYRFVDKRNVIIQLNEPIIGCTTAENYEFHTLSGEVIPVTSAVSAFQEIGGEAPNVFRLTTGKDLQVGTTYVVETRGMSWNGKPCQGTIAYITP